MINLFSKWTILIYRKIQVYCVFNQTLFLSCNFYPKRLKESTIKSIIMTSLSKGTLKGTAKNGYKTYTYKLNKHGNKNMKVVVNKDGVIVTAYPTSGTSVKVKK
ncbi:hypothetical protein MKZ08_08825 [Viridibacillus sp. FSL R5-0477]|uniref:Uncharacterized protein n=1 Tax=Viridibacillus arenosi FSL R5-213 TaxID=1227360 RepID=W4EWA1_9BACL|nr:MULTISPECIES: hypothetical protein [Viridibacillus]ETT84106.1 hypothetical protein C176_12098 [Viridibacillus arenosi FSL R5-213]OMC79308.1 hypothetical protein BK130_19180 [Viridibacillus sp. FSL H8-0123]OMC90095.1 hypothetical protein BK137_15245 [Viridibacillus arenosi]